MEALLFPAEYASADSPAPGAAAWIETIWERARLRLRESSESLLVLDEVQKIKGWSEVVKRLWDEDSHAGARLKLLILGSSPLLVGRGLTGG